MNEIGATLAAAALELTFALRARAGRILEAVSALFGTLAFRFRHRADTGKSQKYENKRDEVERIRLRRTRWMV